MFTDARSRDVVLIAHCILNQNAISDGTADFPGCDTEIVKLLLQAGVGILQMPCPELNCLGLDRGDPQGGERPVIEENTRIREAMGHAASSRILSSLVERVVFEVEEYRKHGFTIVGLVGINRSPSCGVETTSMNCREVSGHGVFIEALRKELARRDIPLEAIGVKASEPERSAEKVHNFLDQAQASRSPLRHPLTGSSL